MTNGVLASLIIAPLITGRDSRFANVVRPDRVPLGRPALAEFASGQAGAARNMAEHLGPSEVSSLDEIVPGSGAVMRHHSLKKLAVFKDENGQVSACSAVCTHAGCIVHWNPMERCWDCPCHGSQFAPDGRVLCGPAVRALSNAPLDPVKASAPE
jgi:Rieske Fe-S protein